MGSKVDIVIGAAGGCGKLCVEQLLGKGGSVRAVGRVRIAASPANRTVHAALIACFLSQSACDLVLLACTLECH